MTDEEDIKLATIIIIGCCVALAIVGITLTAIFTNRDLLKVEGMTFGAILLIASLGGLSWLRVRRKRRWRLERQDVESED